MLFDTGCSLRELYVQCASALAEAPFQEAPSEVLEAGIRYAAQPARGQKTGFYAGKAGICRSMHCSSA